MFEVSGSIDIGRPVVDVFAYLSDPTNNVKWESGVVEMELTSDGPVEVGSTGRRVEKYMGTDEGTWEVTEFQEPRSLAVSFESQKFIGDGRWDLEPIDAGTSLTYRFSGNAKNPLWRLLTPLMTPMVRRYIRRDYGTLKQILEASGS